MYVHTSLYTYSDRYVLGFLLCVGGLLLCAGGIALLCSAVLCLAVLAVGRHIYSYIRRLLYKMLENIHAGSLQFCMLASIVW